jgi:hypothetical protein
MNERQAFAFSRPLARAAEDISWARRIEPGELGAVVASIVTVNR